jgi:hypothetical protein
MESRSIAELVFHIGRIATGEGFVEGITSAQWAALRYFAQAKGTFANDPFESLVCAADSLPPSVKVHFVNALQRMLGQVPKRGVNLSSVHARLVNIWKTMVAAGRKR